jgi:hypothetical protein
MIELSGWGRKRLVYNGRLEELEGNVNHFEIVLSKKSLSFSLI